MKVIAQVPVHQYHVIFETINDATTEFLDYTLSSLDLTLSYKTLSPVHMKCQNRTVIASFQLNIGVYSEHANRDDLEKNLSATFSNDRRLEIYGVGNQSIDIFITDKCFPKEIFNTMFFMCDEQFMLFQHTQMEYKTIKTFYADLAVNDLLWCPQVELNSTEYSFENNSNNVMVVANNKTLTQSEYQQTLKGTLKVCIFNYKRLQTTSHIASSTTGLLSLICTCISLTFLVMSVVVYIANPHFRTAVSRNNITLALNLMVAQTLFEFGAEQIEFPLMCLIIGFLSHYFWLSSVFWMNACVINLLYTICFPLHSRAQSELNIYIFLCLYCFITPGVIVMITSLSNYLVLGFSGYGRGICYLSNATSRIYGLAVPVGILVCVNVLLFLYTIITIYRLPKLKSTSKNKISMIMCINLSTITGASWLFGYAYEATGFIGFAYMFSIFLGSIGLFLFLTFFAIKIKRGLCDYVLGRCVCSRPVACESTSTVTELAVSSGDVNGHM